MKKSKIKFFEVAKLKLKNLIYVWPLWIFDKIYVTFQNSLLFVTKTKKTRDDDGRSATAAVVASSLV